MKSVQCWKLYDYNVHENGAYYEGSNFRDIYPEKTCRNIHAVYGPEFFY